MRYDAIITAEVNDERPKRSPLVQGGLGILIEMFIVWMMLSNRGLYRPKQRNIGDYTDQSNEILREMRVDVDDEDEES